MLANFDARSKILILVSALLILPSCSTVYPLGSVAKRELDPRLASRDIAVETSVKSGGRIRNLAWAAFSVTFDCPKSCPFTVEERSALSREIADASFDAFDKSIRRVMGSDRNILQTEETVRSSAFAHDIKSDSFRLRVSHWFERLGLSRNPEVTVSAKNLKSVNPEELGWSGGQSLAALGKSLGVDGVLVGHIRVTPDPNAKKENGTEKKIVITGPKLWVFSSNDGMPIAVARLRLSWRPDPRLEGAVQNMGQLNLKGLEDVALGFSSRVADAISD